MDNVNSSGEVELLSSINLRDDQLDMSVVENELARIKNYKKIGDDNIVNVLEDCITNSTLSIQDLIQYSNNTSNNSIKSNTESEIKNEVETPKTVEKVDSDNTVDAKSSAVELDGKNLIIKVNDDISINLRSNDLNISIRSQSELIGNKFKLVLFFMLLLILIK